MVTNTVVNIDPNVDNAIVSLSGGLDSTCLLLHLLSKGVKHVRCFAFDYGQKHTVEIKKAKKNIKFLQGKGFDVTFDVLNLRDVWSDSPSSLHGTDKEIPKGDYSVDTQRSTCIPCRNVIFSQVIAAKALSWADETGENVLITLGVHANDNSTYPDTRPESVEMSRQLFKISNWGTERVDYIAPFEYFDKGHVLQAGIDAMKTLGFTKSEIKRVLRNTHSCYSPDEKGRSCGLCGTCKERLEAFEDCGMADPAEYVED